MPKIENRTAANIPDAAEDAARVKEWMLTLAEEMRETAASVMTKIGGSMLPVSFRPVPVSGILTEQIVSGVRAVPAGIDGFSALQDSGPGQAPVSSAGRQHRRNSRTSYETARELQKQSELLLRT